MSRNYRMRYGGVDKITVHIPATGVEHTLFTEHPGETILDVKRAILPHIRVDDSIHRPHGVHNITLFAMMENGPAEEATDDQTVSSLAVRRIVDFHLFYRDPIRVNIETMYADSYYTLFINDSNATLLDVKRLVLPLIEFPLINHNAPRPLLHQLHFEGVVDDNTLVSSLAHNNIVQLELSPIL